MKPEHAGRCRCGHACFREEMCLLSYPLDLIKDSVMPACLPSAFDSLLQKEPGYSIVIVVTPFLAILEDQVGYW